MIETECILNPFSLRMCEKNTVGCAVVHDLGRPFQHRVAAWMRECFGPSFQTDKTERVHRFVEEALELAQASECTKSEAYQLVDYVFNRPVGEPGQEVGGVMTTLAALCLTQGLDIAECRETELSRVWSKIDAIREKQDAKPKHSPLPEEPKVDEVSIPKALLDVLIDGVEAGYHLVTTYGLEESEAAQAVEEAYHSWLLSEYSPEPAETDRECVHPPGCTRCNWCGFLSS